MNRLLTSRLCSHVEIRQVMASNLADAAAQVVDHVVADQWRQILASIGTPIIARAQRRAHAALLGVVPAAKAAVADSLHKIASWGHRTARNNLRSSLPLGYLKATAASKRPVLENDPRIDEAPGMLELIMRSIADANVGVAPSPLALLAGDTEHDVAKQAFVDLLFPPPPKDVVDSIVYAKVNGATWEQRLDGATRTSATPAQLADVVAQGVAQGKTNAEIARLLLPVVDGVRSSARRIARTEGLRVAQAMQVRAWDGLGDMLLGYQIRAVLDERTRPAHRLRNGTIYYREPKAGQKGLDECPQPPVEPDGTTAWNCRCHLVPQLDTPDYLDEAAKRVFSDHADELTSDPATYSDWFATAAPRDRRTAVGPRRYQSASEALGGAVPSYHHFVDPLTPDGLIDVSRLRSESPSDRAARVAAVATLIDQRRALIRRVETLGLA